MTGPRDEACLLPQIDHLTVAQLRRRASDDREDALRLCVRRNAGAATMLLADAERCEARAAELEAPCAPPRPAGPEGPTVEGAPGRVPEPARGSVAGLQALAVHGADGGSQHAFAAPGPDGSRHGCQGSRAPAVPDAYRTPLRSPRPAEALP